MSQFRAIAYFSIVTSIPSDARNYLRVSSNVGCCAFTSRATGYSIHLYRYTREARTYANVRSRGAKTEEEAEKEGHSIMLSTTWPLTVPRRRGMRDEERGGGAYILLRSPARSLRSDARPVRHQTSYIDHIIGRRSFRYTR